MLRVSSSAVNTQRRPWRVLITSQLESDQRFDSEDQQLPRRAGVVQRVPGSLYDASVRTRLSQPRADPDRCSPRSMGTFIINDDQQRAPEHAEAPHGRGGGLVDVTSTEPK